MKNLRSSKLKIIARETKLVMKGLASTRHPILAHVIPMRRCNLSCGYCNEYDKVSEPVPLDVMKGRLDRRNRVVRRVCQPESGDWQRVAGAHAIQRGG